MKRAVGIVVELHSTIRYSIQDDRNICLECEDHSRSLDGMALLSLLSSLIASKLTHSTDWISTSWSHHHNLSHTSHVL